MSTAQLQSNAKAAAPPAQQEITIYDHSTLMYWWPVWAVGYLLAFLTYVQGQPMRFELGPGEHRCTIHLSGVVTREDLEAGVIAQVAAGAWTRQTLLDGTHVTDMTALWRDMQQLVQFVRSTTQGLPPRGRTVILADGRRVFGFSGADEPGRNP